MTAYNTLWRQTHFIAYLATQFLGAMNDNIYRTVVSLLVVSQAAHGGYLSLAAVLFIVPSLIFSGFAGYLADKYSKNRVLVITKGFEIAAMSLAFFVLPSSSYPLMLLVLFLMATQSAFFSPAKYGILPELLPVSELSRANGLLEMTTFSAIIVGTAFGGLLLHFFRDSLFVICGILVAVAMIGFWTSLQIGEVKPSGGSGGFSGNPWHEIISGCYRLQENRTLLIAVIAISYFWGLGMAAHLNTFLYGKAMLFGDERLPLSDLGISMLNVSLGIGIAIGGYVAGLLSGDKIETGIIPIGTLGVSLMLILAAVAPPNYSLVGFSFFGLGFFSGFFVLPLNALLQYLPHGDEKGRLIATANFFNGIAMIVAATAIWIAFDLLGWSPATIFAVIGGISLLSGLALLVYLPHGVQDLLLWLMTHTLYRVTQRGVEHVPEHGPALIVCNHVSYLDGLLLSAVVPRPIRFLVYKPIYDSFWLGWLFKAINAIPVQGGDEQNINDAIVRTREALERGDVVGIFAEGSISRTGQLLPFRRGLERILEGTDIPVVPAHLDRLWDSVFAMKKKGGAARFPSRLLVPVTVSFAEVLPSHAKAWQVRQAVQRVGSEAQQFTDHYQETLPERLLKMARYRPLAKMAMDTSGDERRGIQFLSEMLLLSRYFRRLTYPGQEIAVMLPPSMDNTLVLSALACAGCVAVNLPYDLGLRGTQAMMTEHGVQRLLTSREMIQHLKFPEIREMMFVEDLPEFSAIAKIRAGIHSLLLPAQSTITYFGVLRQPDSPVVVVFPRYARREKPGVVLSHRSVLGNVAGLELLFRNARDQRQLSILPSFSAMGYTCNLWFPLLTGITLVLHRDMKDYQALAKIYRSYKINIIINTPREYQRYIRNFRGEDLAYIQYAIAGGTKVSDALWKAFRDKFSIELLEGYGCTEMGPVISLNIHHYKDKGYLQKGNKMGSVGTPLPGLTARVVSPETEQECQVDEEGLLLVKGPGTMLGYWQRPELTKEAFEDGWYNTREFVSLDHEGFLFFSGNSVVQDEPAGKRHSFWAGFLPRKKPK